MSLETLQSDPEIQMLKNAVEAVRHLDGDMVEVGVYKGGTAKILKEANKSLHLFDTWEGIKETSAEDLKTHSKLTVGRYLADMDEARETIGEASYYKGIFPVSYKENIERVALLHIDVDLYAPTKAALEIFWPKIVSGGLIVVHDYPSFEGVRMAVDEALEGKVYIKISTTPEQVIIIPL